MDFDFPSDNDPRRSELRAWLAGHPSPTSAELHEAGLLVPHWPRPWGVEADPIHQLIIDEVFIVLILFIFFFIFDFMNWQWRKINIIINNNILHIPLSFIVEIHHFVFQFRERISSFSFFLS